MSQLSFDVIKRVWPKSGLVTLFKKYSRLRDETNAIKGPTAACQTKGCL